MSKVCLIPADVRRSFANSLQAVRVFGATDVFGAGGERAPGGHTFTMTCWLQRAMCCNSHLTLLRRTASWPGPEPVSHNQNPTCRVFVEVSDMNGSTAGFATPRRCTAMSVPNGLAAVKGPAYMSGRLPAYAVESAMQPGFVAQVGQSSSSGYLSGSGSPQSLIAGRGISLPASFHNMKFGDEGSPHSPVAAADLAEQLPPAQESTASFQAPMQHRDFRPAGPPLFDAEFLQSAPRSAPSSSEGMPRSQLRPHAQQHGETPGAALPQSTPHAAPGLLPSELGTGRNGMQQEQPMPVVQGRPQYSTVAGGIPDRLSFLPRTESVVSITRASSV